MRSAAGMKSAGETRPRRELRQDFEAGGVLAHRVHDRLEHQVHLGAEIGGAEQVLDDAAAADLGLELAREDHGAAAQMALGVIERVVGAFIERFGAGRRAWEQREADRAGQPGMGGVELVGQLDLFADALAEPHQIVIFGIAAHHEAELVAAEPGKFHPLRAEALANFADAAPGFDQDAIADRVAVIVVDRLEAVEVDDPHRDANAPALGVGEGARQLGEEAAAVRQLGEGIEIGEAEVLVRERLGCRLLRQQRFAARDEIGEVAVVDEQHRHHRA
ncbi:hypothetical protein ABIB99_005156 [Bradyrhizobium sp. LA6.1]